MHGSSLTARLWACNVLVLCKGVFTVFINTLVSEMEEQWLPRAVSKEKSVHRKNLAHWWNYCVKNVFKGWKGTNSNAVKALILMYGIFLPTANKLWTFCGRFSLFCSCKLLFFSCWKHHSEKFMMWWLTKKEEGAECCFVLSKWIRKFLLLHH